MSQINDTTKRFKRSLNEARPWEHPVIQHYKGKHWSVSSWFSAVCFALAVLVLFAVYLEWI